MAKKSVVRVEDIRLKWAIDPDADPGDVPPAEIYLSCVAEATVSYAIGERGDRRLEHLTSGGLYGIGVDEMADPYLDEVADEQLDDLRIHLRAFKIDPSDAEWMELRRRAINSQNRRVS